MTPEQARECGLFISRAATAAIADFEAAAEAAGKTVEEHADEDLLAKAAAVQDAQPKKTLPRAITAVIAREAGVKAEAAFRKKLKG